MTEKIVAAGRGALGTQIETHLVDLYQAIDQVRAVSDAAKMHTENGGGDEISVAHLFDGIVSILHPADGDTLAATIAAVRSLVQTDSALPTEKQADSDAATPITMSASSEATDQSGDAVRALMDIDTLAKLIDDAIDDAIHAEGGDPIEGSALHEKILALLTAICHRVDRVVRVEVRHG